VERRRAEPKQDLISALVREEIDGERLSDEALVSEALLLLVGGNETTRNVISGGMEMLMRHPDQRQRLIEDPALIPAAAEECLRWVSPILNMNRTATQDFELHGETIRAGDQVLLMYASANRDATVFADPETFDVGRNPNPHVAFGFGPHFCLGAMLARMEIRVMFEEVLRRLPDLRLGADDVARTPSTFIRGIMHMPVVRLA
jgi:cytochrome P450 family 142 subfamily A polypeptide 1